MFFPGEIKVLYHQASGAWMCRIILLCRGGGKKMEELDRRDISVFSLSHSCSLFLSPSLSQSELSSIADFKDLMSLKIPLFTFNEKATLQIKEWPQRLSDVCGLAGRKLNPMDQNHRV